LSWAERGGAVGGAWLSQTLLAPGGLGCVFGQELGPDGGAIEQYSRLVGHREGAYRIARRVVRF